MEIEDELTKGCGRREAPCGAELDSISPARSCSSALWWTVRISAWWQCPSLCRHRV